MSPRLVNGIGIKKKRKEEPSKINPKKMKNIFKIKKIIIVANKNNAIKIKKITKKLNLCKI